MDTSVIVILIIAALIVLAIAVYVVRQRQARQLEERREEAHGTREEARAASVGPSRHVCRPRSRRSVPAASGPRHGISSARPTSSTPT